MVVVVGQVKEWCAAAVVSVRRRYVRQKWLQSSTARLHHVANRHAANLSVSESLSGWATVSEGEAVESESDVW